MATFAANITTKVVDVFQAITLSGINAQQDFTFTSPAGQTSFVFVSLQIDGTHATILYTESAGGFPPLPSVGANPSANFYSVPGSTFGMYTVAPGRSLVLRYFSGSGANTGSGRFFGYGLLNSP